MLTVPRRRLGRGTALTCLLALSIGIALASPSEALARGCNISALAPARSADGDRASARVDLACYGNSGGTLYVELWQYRGLGYWSRKAFADYHIARDANRRYTATWTCAAGTGIQTYETRFWAGVTFQANNGNNFLVEYSDYNGPDARFRCPA
jgi:hypothetical protein